MFQKITQKQFNVFLSYVLGFFKLLILRNFHLQTFCMYGSCRRRYPLFNAYEYWFEWWEYFKSVRIPMSKIISLFKKNLCLGELKMGQNRLQVKKGEHN